MNGHEQRAHKTVTDRLAEDLNTVEGLLHETARRVFDLQTAVEQIREAAVLQGRVLSAQEQHLAALSAWLTTDVWGRLRWLLRGRDGITDLSLFKSRAETDR